MAARAAPPLLALLVVFAPAFGSAEEAPAAPPIPREATPLPVKGYQDASHVGPADSSQPSPLVVVLHGNYDRPEWECELWSRILGGGTWVLCTRGVRRPGTTDEEDRWTYPSLASCKAELGAAVAALRARYGSAVGEGVHLLVGMSLGSMMARDMAIAEPKRFARLALVEGGTSGWTDPVARSFQKGGGARVVFACGQAGCAERARAAVEALRKAGAVARLVSDPSAGHNYSEKMILELREACALPSPTAR
jgi:poly(3-hydroxybutyrate) depolymerase